MRYQLTSFRMAIIKKSANNKGWQGCGERETHALLIGMHIGAATMENSVKIPQEIKNRAAIQFRSWYLSEENKNTVSKRYVHLLFSLQHY